MSSRSLQINPALKTATWEDIKAMRNALEQSPIETDYGTFDADRDSIIRMDSALASFELLPTLAGGELGWKLANNAIVMMTKAELQEVRSAITVRASVLFVKAEIIKAGGSYQVKDLDNPVLWGLTD